MIDQQIHKNLEILLNPDEDLSLRIDAFEIIGQGAPVDMLDFFYEMTHDSQLDHQALYGLGSIIGSIWVKLNKYDIDKLYRLNLHTRDGILIIYIETIHHGSSNPNSNS